MYINEIETLHWNIFVGLFISVARLQPRAKILHHLSLRKTLSQCARNGVAVRDEKEFDKEDIFPLALYVKEHELTVPITLLGFATLG